MTTFCVEHGLTRKSFYELRKRAKTDGPAAVLEPKSRRPAASPSKLTDEAKEQLLQVRTALEASGLDCGPISVHDKMHAIGIGPCALDRVIGADLPRSWCRSSGAEEEALKSQLLGPSEIGRPRFDADEIGQARVDQLGRFLSKRYGDAIRII